MKRVLCLITMFCIPILMIGQSIDLMGFLESDAGMNIENVHVINKTSKYFTITDKQGEFMIPVKLNDTLNFSSIQHKPKEVVISEDIIKSRILYVSLEEYINELDAVLVGKVLSGDLMFDVQNTEGKAPVNFYDFGIPGYTGKPATQSERRLSEATTGPNGQKLKWYSPLMGSIPLNPIINGITGRTKQLKEHVKIEEKEVLIRSIKARLSNDFFISNPLANDLKMDYFYFCMDDNKFLERCKNKTDFEVMIFLKTKYNQYIENRKLNKN